MEIGEIGAHMVSAPEPVEEERIRDIGDAMTQVQSSEDAHALDLLQKLRLAKRMAVRV